MPVNYADRSVARRVAAALRARRDCVGLLVPSLAFPDQPERGNLVVFAERVGPPAQWLHDPLRSANSTCVRRLLRIRS